MHPITIGLIVLFLLALGGFGYGRAYPGENGPSPLVNLLGLLALILIVVVVTLLVTGWKFGLEVSPPH